MRIHFVHGQYVVVRSGSNKSFPENGGLSILRNSHPLLFFGVKEIGDRKRNSLYKLAIF